MCAIFFFVIVTSGVTQGVNKVRRGCTYCAETEKKITVNPKF